MSFRAALGRQGFEHAAGIHAAMKKHRPPFEPEEAAVNALADESSSGGHNPRRERFKFNTQGYAESGNAYESLDEAYVEAKQNDLGERSFEKALELNPADEDAQRQREERRGRQR